jgi:hypothetical protein
LDIKLKLGIATVSALVMASALATGAQAATFVANTSAASGTLHTPGVTDVQNQTLATPTSTAAASAMDRSADQAARASSASTASAELGAAHAFSTAQAETFAAGCCTAAGAGSSAYAEYSDSVVFHSATIADGTHAQFTANILIDGSAGGVYDGAFWSSNQFWRSTVGANGQYFVNAFSSGGNATNGLTTTGSNAVGMQTFVFDIVFGQASTVLLRLETTASAGAGGFGYNSAVVTTDFSHTLAWAGITGLTVGGVTMTDFSAISTDTGFDFVRGYGAAPTAGGVPEPATWALMLLGFGSAGVMIRRRRSTVALGA